MSFIIPEILKTAIINDVEINNALMFATLHHNETGVLRAISGEPYIVHPVAVATILLKWGAPRECIIAGLLHDVVEDTRATIEEINEIFGEDVALIVDGLTNIARKEDGNRAYRTALNIEHSRQSDWRSKLVKVADISHNCSDLHLTTKSYYLLEKWEHLHAIWDERLKFEFDTTKNILLKTASLMNVQLKTIPQPSNQIAHQQ